MTIPDHGERARERTTLRGFIWSLALLLFGLALVSLATLYGTFSLSDSIISTSPSSTSATGKSAVPAAASTNPVSLAGNSAAPAPSPGRGGGCGSGENPGNCEATAVP